MKRLVFFLLFMAIGTLGFYVLLVNEPFKRPPAPAEAEPEPVNVATLQQVKVHQLDGERLAWELDAASAVLDEGSDVAELQDVRFVLYRTPTAQADAVVFRGRSGTARLLKPKNLLVLEGNVHLVQEGRMDLRGQRVEYHEAQGRVEAFDQVRVESDQLVAQGDHMAYDIGSEHVTLTDPLMFY